MARDIGGAIGHVTPAGRSVLLDLELDPAWVAKAVVATDIKHLVRGGHATVDDAVGALGVNAPAYQALRRGQLDDFTLEQLSNAWEALGCNG